jgi:hypothetical protein
MTVGSCFFSFLAEWIIKHEFSRQANPIFPDKFFFILKSNIAGEPSRR